MNTFYTAKISEDALLKEKMLKSKFQKIYKLL